jgi:hypothetical protein
MLPVDNVVANMCKPRAKSFGDSRRGLTMDADLEVMRSIQRFKPCVECLLGPLLKERALSQMPCKHKKTFELARQARRRRWRRRYEELGLDDPGEDLLEDDQYCDCIPFNRRNSLWELGELCVKYSLTRTQMRELAAILLLITREEFAYNHVKRAMHDMFQGAYKDYLKAYSRKRDEGASFEETVAGLVPRWQFRMMPNC